MFQFHKGSINTNIVVAVITAAIRFNSIKVRLIQEHGLAVGDLVTCFNSIKVRLILWPLSQGRRRHGGFNSIKVRLIPSGSFCLHTGQMCFNSIKVRLILVDRNADADTELFQFHKGSINT